MTANFQSSALVGVEVLVELGDGGRDAKVALELIDKFMVEGIEEFIIVGVDLGKFDALQECASDISLGVRGCFDALAARDSSTCRRVDPFAQW